MSCLFSELRNKEVIDLRTGARLGYVCDAEYDPAEDCFRLHYCVAPEEYAEITYRGMEGLTFEPYTDPYAVDQALWLKTGT